MKEAITAYQDAAAIYRHASDHRGEGDALNNLGLALAKTRKLNDAMSAFQAAAAIYAEIGDIHAEFRALDNLDAARAARQAF